MASLFSGPPARQAAIWTGLALAFFALGGTVVAIKMLLRKRQRENQVDG